MKKDRNCMMPMPYPMYGGMMPQNNFNNDINDRLNSLEQRVSNLEKLLNKNYTNYNNQGYQMM